MKPRTFYDKIWADHLVDEQPDGTCLLYIDRHIVHEVTSPQAFEGLRLSGRKVHAPDKTLLVVDHNVPTTDRTQAQSRPESADQIAYLAENAKHFNLEYYDEFDIRQGICHVIGPEQGFTLPGVTLVCGDSHTATHGAFGALAYGIGTSEVEHVLATQTLVQTKSKNMRAVVDGKLPPNVTAKDIILAIIGEIGTAGGTGYSLEYAGEAIRALSMEGRMTVCNMSVEAGAKAGFIAPDEKTYEYRQGPPEGAEGQAVGRRAALLGDAADRRRRALRPRGQARRRQAAADRDLGHEPRAGHVDHRPRAGAVRDRRRAQAPRRRALARIHGPEGRREDHRHRDQPRVHRLLHQLAHRGSARGGAHRRRQEGQRQRQRHDRAGLRPGEGAGRGRRAATRSSWPPASNGASRAARCASR